MNGKTVDLSNEPGPWNLVAELSETLGSDSLILAGGMMVQVYAAMLKEKYGKESMLITRKTVDVDFLVDLMAKGAHVDRVVRKLSGIGCEIQVPAFHNAVFYRMLRDN